MSIKDGKLLYHITALSNIESIFKDGLLSRANLKDDFKDVAEQDIIEFRNTHKITNLIPFHFFAGTPFAGRIQIDYPDEEFIYITIHRDVAKSDKNDFKIFPTHPKHMNPLEIYSYEEGFEKIDWKLMEKRDYSSYECKEICMAECVANHSSVPSKIFHSIIVKSDQTKEYLEKLYYEIFEENAPFHINVNSTYFKK
ncbi:hypothetical protein AF79_08050 [Aliarcobacter butzleri L354]|uniref:DarT ssDNA thymidine ADP-ribosyltransferase family protein n=1 Tax=Aliarcobacter butzleri TaxID=28197 RepID=UPI00063A96B9|nr:DarT ssDNA thymidine ADP-ribosyltransferase family protein [Aliarcobacter butzleri]KLE08378.1 hypothetical protein AF79_08050 [Aliarcobacter butzleri L354]